MNFLSISNFDFDIRIEIFALSGGTAMFSGVVQKELTAALTSFFLPTF